jgi:hypothetical protein
MTDINKIFLGYQLCQLIENQYFRDKLCPHLHQILMMGMELVPETLIFNKLAQLIAQEDFVKVGARPMAPKSPSPSKLMKIYKGVGGPLNDFSACCLTATMTMRSAVGVTADDKLVLPFTYSAGLMAQLYFLLQWCCGPKEAHRLLLVV